MRKLVEYLIFVDPVSPDRLEEQIATFLKTNPNDSWELGAFHTTPWFDDDKEPPQQNTEYLQILVRYEEVAK